MKFELTPVKEIPEYISVYCDFDKGNHDHLPIIWRCTFRTAYAGWASWGWKYGMVNLYRLGQEFNNNNNYVHLINDFLRIYYHEFLHLFFRFRLRTVLFKGKMRDVSSNEDVIDLLARLLTKCDLELYHWGGNWINLLLWEEITIGV